MITLVRKFCILLLIVGIIQAKLLKGDELEKLQKVRSFNIKLKLNFQIFS